MTVAVTAMAGYWAWGTSAAVRARLLDAAATMKMTRDQVWWQLDGEG